MFEIQPPNFFDTSFKNKLFLAGSIEMGTAEQWQRWVIDNLHDVDGVIFNPRRVDWNASWKQDISDPNFNLQVTWELQAMEAADLVLFYFDPATKSPITLMELGLVASNAPECAIVVCPDGFYRKGNVDIVCRRYGISQMSDLPTAMEAIREYFH